MAFRAELGEVELVDDVRQEVEQVLAADFKVRLLPLLPELLQDGRVDFARRTSGLFNVRINSFLLIRLVLTSDHFSTKMTVPLLSANFRLI